MTQSINPPPDRRQAGSNIQYWALLACLVVTLAIAVPVVVHAPSSDRVPFTVGVVLAAGLLCAAVTVAVHYWELARRVQQSAAARVAESAAAAAAANDAAAQQAWELRRSESRRTAALTAFAAAAGRMQAMTTAMLAELREMEHRHADPGVLADLLQLDHRTAQAGRLADSIAVLSGARSGRRWAKPIPMESILRGAMGRIAGYQRVRLRAIADVAVAGHAAEGVMHALAELLDNACNFSPPTTEVHVYAGEVPAGVVLTIEDSGLVMSESALRRAERAVAVTDRDRAGAGPATDLSTLTGTRLGLSVVGHLARKHGLTVSFRSSAIGGTAVLVMIPRELVSRVERAEIPAAVDVPAAPEEAGPDTGLPKRRRGSALAAAHPDGLTASRRGDAVDPAPRPAPSPSALGAFQRAGTLRADRPFTIATNPSDSAPVEND